MIKILIADDEPLIRRSLKRLFSDCEVIECEDGKSAIRDWKLYQPQIVILDVLMPERTGYQVVQEISEELKRDTVIVVMSAYSGSDVEKDSDLDLFVKKPFENILELKKMILGLL